MNVRTCGVVTLVLLLSSSFARGATPLINLDTESPYYPNLHYPKLTTPQWVGEAGVDAVVVLAIDDMKDHRRYEPVLQPIIDRLKKIDGHAPISIMTCKIDPATPKLQEWLKDGLSFEVHTVDHPCPILAGGDFARAKSTYDRCVDQVFSIPNNSPVAFRTPCCDSLNTPSPRLYEEIFNKTSPGGHFLQMDSSVFNISTPNDPALARDLVIQPDGRERFRKYVPFDSFVNTIDDYPYPYIIGRLCWEFSCATPSDWQAQYLQKNANPLTTSDWKALLDITVAKKGVMTMVFHPYGWSSPQQFVELIDHATSKYGKRVKFMNFREANERLTKNLTGGTGLRAKDGSDAGVRLIDLNHDSYLDVVRSADHKARVWDPGKQSWSDAKYPADLQRAEELAGDAQGYLRDLDKDGRPELIVGSKVYGWDPASSTWNKLPLALPTGMTLANGGFLVDVDENGMDDLLLSNDQRCALYLMDSMQKGWTRKVFDVKRGQQNGKYDLLPVVRSDGSNNGLWVHSRTLWWQNEDTDKLPNLVDRRSFNTLLRETEPLAKSPAASMACIRLAPGYKIELVAAEPLVQDPMAFAWGPDGKMWVVEMADYPLGEDGHGKPGGRVRFLEDTDGDGVYDKSTIFLHDAPYPTSVLPWKKGVLVAAAPDIFYAQDTDGDGKADKREVLFTGFKEGNQQHRLNHLSFGLDNWIYGANGDSGGTVKSIKTGKSVSISGRDFRFRPDTGEFEAIAGQSQFGRSRTDGGDWFGCNNSNPLWHFPLDEHYLKRNPHVPASSGALRVDVPPIPGASPVFPISVTRARFNDPQAANHFTSACSVHVYRDDLLPVPAGSLEVFVSEPVHNLVHREIVTPAGFTFAGKRAPGEEASEFLASSDEWFRPTTVDTGPDGALYIADMYRQVIEHPQWIPKDWQERLDLRAGHELGRIYRITPTTAKPRTIKWLNKLDDVGLVAALDSSNGWQRDLAQWMLLWRRSPAAGPALEELLKNSKNPLARAHALWTLAGLAPDAELKPRVIVEALADSAATVRRQAVKIAERFLGGNEAAKPQAADVGWALAQMSNEADPQVRLQLAYSLGEWDDPRAADVLARLAAQDSADRFMLAAILSSINEHNVRAVAAAVTEEAERNPPSPALLAGLFRAAVGTSNGDAIASTLAALTAKRGAGQYAPWQFQTMANLLDSLDESGLDLSKLGKDNRAIAAAAKGVDDVVRGARTTASDEGATPDLRAAAVGLLGRDPVNRKQDLAALDRMLSPQSPRELQAAVIRAIARRREGGLAKTLLDHWKGLTPDLRASAVDAMLARNERAKMLLDAVEKKSILPTEIDPARRQRLLQSPDKSVRERAEALLADVVSPNRQKVIDALSEAAILKGDAAKGQQIFTNTCAQCHRLGEIGKVVGPDLLSVGDKSPQGLLIAILDPNRAVEPRYVNYIATTRDGETYTGLLAAEAATSITLLGPDAQQQTIRRQDLTDLRSSNTSLMPEGIEANLKAQDLADLIAFVRAAR